jgi:hypothetical protein
MRRPSRITPEGFFVSENFFVDGTTRATEIDPQKIRAYLATHYHVGHTDCCPVLRIGATCTELGPLFASHDIYCAGFLTAYNPRGTQQSDLKNEASHLLLHAQLSALGLTLIEGSGSEPGTNWPAERSYFALGLTRDAASDFGRVFDQDAIVWVGDDLVPQLILLR